MHYSWTVPDILVLFGMCADHLLDNNCQKVKSIPFNSDSCITFDGIIKFKVSQKLWNLCAVNTYASTLANIASLCGKISDISTVTYSRPNSVIRCFKCWKSVKVTIKFSFRVRGYPNWSNLHPLYETKNMKTTGWLNCF